MSKLPLHEWLIISLLIATLMMLAFITLFRTADTPPITTISHELNAAMINVTIKGAVSQVGSYELKKGALVQDLLAMARPLPEADLSKLKPESRLRNHQVVKVPAEIWITVNIEGAILNPGALRVKLGTFAKDLIELLAFQPDADIKKLEKKRRLKDNEVIHVGVKKSKKANPRKKTQNAPDVVLEPVSLSISPQFPNSL